MAPMRAGARAVPPSLPGLGPAQVASAAPGAASASATLSGSVRPSRLSTDGPTEVSYAAALRGEALASGRPSGASVVAAHTPAASSAAVAAHVSEALSASPELLARLAQPSPPSEQDEWEAPELLFRSLRSLGTEA